MSSGGPRRKLTQSQIELYERILRTELYTLKQDAELIRRISRPTYGLTATDRLIAEIKKKRKMRGERE